MEYNIDVDTEERASEEQEFSETLRKYNKEKFMLKRKIINIDEKIKLLIDIKPNIYFLWLIFFLIFTIILAIPCGIIFYVVYGNNKKINIRINVLKIKKNNLLTKYYEFTKKINSYM